MALCRELKTNPAAYPGFLVPGVPWRPRTVAWRSTPLRVGMWVPSLASEGVDIGQMAEELHIQKGLLSTQHLPLTLLLP